MLQDEEEYKKENFLFILLMTVNVSITLVVMLVACLCCKKKIPKNDGMMGLEGMVKLKNPDEVLVVTTLNASESHADLNHSTISQGDSEKRASTAAHRSLPDIPVADANGDTGSELYETVADKMQLEAQNQNKSPTPSLKKQISVSQHSSISQADDVSSPYSRVKNSPHDYAKVRPTEHPYAQLNAPSTSQSTHNAQLSTSHIDINAQSTGTQVSTMNEHQQQRASHHSDGSQNRNDSPAPQVEIPAASAIAGMISASQDLPYMTPPIANQHFSGDSQDSSKGYTSISVREPLANILAQQPKPQTQIHSTSHSRDVNDSHYATVSDDSDETYAAIEDPNTRLQHANATTDIYTSGSETYAQIQPMQSPNSILVSVEINNVSTTTLTASTSTMGVTTHQHNSSLLSSSSDHHVVNTTTITQHSTSTLIGPLRTSLEHNMNTPIPPPVDSLRAQMHSRQASASSNNSSSLCNLGSPKPEKRQANSPLPPTPKSNVQALSSTSNLTSGRNSVISVIECSGELNELGSGEQIHHQDGSSPQKRNKSLSPSKDIEGMYAKVMKKNKFSRNSPSSQNNSPVMQRKHDDHAAAALGISPLDSMAADLLENSVSVLSTTDRSRLRSNSYGATKDHGYETIPADAMRSNSSHGVIENRKSDCYAHILQKERQREGVHTSAKPPITVYSVQLSNISDKHYETIANPSLPSSSNDPGYETILKTKLNSSLNDDSEKKSSDYDPNYEVLKGPNIINITNSAGASDDGYAKVLEKKRINIDEDSIDGYSKVKGEEETDDIANTMAGGYSTIADVKGRPDANHNYASILETKGGGGVGEGDANLETDSDHYARIAEKTELHTPNLPLSNSNRSMVDELLTPRTADLSITSPTSLTSSSMLNTSSINSTSTNLNTTSTISSRQTPTSSSQYESLTGSETDPNYESVCYLNSTGQENPYERLQTEFSDDTQLSTPPLSPATSTNSSITAQTPSNAAAQTEQQHSISKRLTTNGSKINLTPDPNADILVNDYFQV